jgi:phospholipid/cholesterol/gamma-HCH transport system substrate-binding protein
VVIGAVGLLVIALLMVAAFNVDKLPLIGGGPRYTAAFSEAGGLKPGDEVRIAGVKVGKVEGVSLDKDHVKVTFRITTGAVFGTQTTASIRVKTILGAKYLSLEPKGPGRLRAGAQIPLSRTMPAYDVVQAFSDLTTTIEQIDTTRLATALDTIAATFKDSPRDVRTSIDGLSRISQAVSKRDAALRDLLKHANGVTGVLSARSGDLTTLIDDGDKLFTELQARHEAIHRLLVTAGGLAVQLSGLVADNRTQLGPALARLDSVVSLLKRNETSLERGIELLAPFARMFANTLGNGRWFDSYVQNLVAVPPLPSTVPSPGGSR